MDVKEVARISPLRWRAFQFFTGMRKWVPHVPVRDGESCLVVDRVGFRTTPLWGNESWELVRLRNHAFGALANETDRYPGDWNDRQESVEPVIQALLRAANKIGEPRLPDELLAEYGVERCALSEEEKDG